MNPILFSLGSLKFYTYGIIVFLSWATGFAVSYLLVLKYKTKRVDKFDTLLYITLSGFLGARALYFLFNYYKFDSFWQMFYFWQNGMWAYGGLFTGTMFSLWYFIKKEEKIWFWLDNITIGFYSGYFATSILGYLFKYGHTNLIQLILLGIVMLGFIILRLIKIRFFYQGFIFLAGLVFFSLGQLIFELISKHLIGFDQIFSLIIFFLILNLLLEIKIKKKIGIANLILNYSKLTYLRIKQKRLNR